MSQTEDRDRIKREIGYGTGGIAEKLKTHDLVVTHHAPATPPAEPEKPEVQVTILDNGD